MTLAVRSVTEAVYPEAIAMLTDAGHQVHEVSRSLPAFPVLGPANSNSQVVLAVADLPGLPTGLAQRTACPECSTPLHLVVLALQLLRIHEYLLGVAGECIEVVPEPGQDRLRVHGIDSSWHGVSGESVSTLRQLLQGCRSRSVDQSAIIPFTDRCAKEVKHSGG